MSHSIQAVLNAAFAPVADTTYLTPRSGLPVVVGTVNINARESTDYTASVTVKIDGKVDQADAFQLRDFFDALSKRLKEAA